jgi:hypothetical protein
MISQLALNFPTQLPWLSKFLSNGFQELAAAVSCPVIIPLEKEDPYRPEIFASFQDSGFTSLRNICKLPGTETNIALFLS